MDSSALQHTPAMLSAQLTDVEVVGNVDKKRHYFLVVHVDGEAVVKSAENKLDFRPSSTIKFKLFCHSIFFLRGPSEIGYHACKATELLENNTSTVMTLNLTHETDHTSLSSLNVKLSLITDSARDIMRQVDADLERLKSNGVLNSASGRIDNALAIAQTAGDVTKSLGSCVEPLGKALQIFVKMMDGIADAHPIVKASWTVISAVYKVVQTQMLQDDIILSLAESLREMVGAAQKVPDLLVVDGTTDVIQEISRSSLQVASLIDEYTGQPFIGRITRFQVTDDMKTRINACQKKCEELMEKFRLRLAIEQRSVVLDVRDRLETIKNTDLG